MAVRYIPLAEDWKPGLRLGRHIHHDPRSLRYVVPETDTPPVQEWAQRIPILDQGNLGSCTGNAFTGMLGTEPFYDTLDGKTLDEAFAVQRYSRATAVDPYPGQYKPTDTGSDGLSVCKAAQQDGLISGYIHATSLAGCYTMIGTGPFIIGISWWSGMDNPDSAGNVKVSGTIRGGHEVCVVGRLADGRWKIRNSWGTSWGVDGHFYLSDAQLAKLLAQQGDATQGVPVTQPAPTPTPPGPQPTGGFPLAAVDPWLEHAYNFSHIEANAKAAIKAWLASS